MAENSLKKGQYTRFSNKIGLYSANQENVGFIKNNSNVVINFPFKDAVLVGGMSREDVKTTEIFYIKKSIQKILIHYLSQKYLPILNITAQPMRQNLNFLTKMVS